DRKLSVDVFVHGRWIIATSSEAEILRLNFNRYFLESKITIRCGRVERVSAIDVRASRRNQGEIQHGKCAAGGRERSATIFYEGVVIVNVSRGALAPTIVLASPVFGVFNDVGCSHGSPDAVLRPLRAIKMMDTRAAIIARASA